MAFVKASMKLQIDGNSHELLQVTARVAIDEISSVRVRFQESGAVDLVPPATALKYATNRVEAILELADAEVSIPATVVGFDRVVIARPQPDGARLSGNGTELVAAALGRVAYEFFRARPLGDGPSLAVHQCGAGDHAGLEFVQRILLDRVGAIPAVLEKTFHPASCVAYRRDNDFFGMIDVVLRHMRSVNPDLVGWCAVGDAKHPLRLLTMSSPSAITLGPGWADGRFVPTDCLGVGSIPTVVAASLTCTLDCSAPEKLLNAFLTRGTSWQDTDRELGFGENEPFPLIPGTVLLFGQPWLCRAVEVTVSTYLPACTVHLELQCAPARRPEPPTFLLLSRFRHWHEIDKTNTLVELLPLRADIPDWGVVVERNGNYDIDFSTPLLARRLSSQGTPAGGAGLYVTPWQDMPLYVLMAPGSAPIVLGGPDRKYDALESAAVSLSASSLILSNSDPTVKTDAARGVSLDNGALTIDLVEDMRVKAKKVDIECDVAMRNNLDVGT